VEYAAAKNIYFIRYQRHYIFFRQLGQGNIGVIAVLHERMDLPNRLKEAIDSDEL
jgi:toxin ParE1/3/4